MHLTGREEVQVLFFYFIDYLFIFLPSGGGLVPFVHPRKYAPGGEGNLLRVLIVLLDATR